MDLEFLVTEVKKDLVYVNVRNSVSQKSIAQDINKYLYIHIYIVI